MINLLPTEDKRQIRAARVNIVLFRYVIIIVASFLFLMLALGASYVILRGVKQSADTVLSTTSGQSQQNAQVVAQVQSLQSQVAQAKSSLSNQISYSKVLTNLASVLPSGVIVQTLTLTSTSFGTPTTVSFLAKTNAEATKLQSQLQSSPYFSGVSLQSINTNNANPSYPVAATMTLAFNRSIAQ